MKEKNYKNLSEKQTEVSNKIKNLNSKHSKRYIALPSAPGSGKTTTLLGGLEFLFSEVALKKDMILKIDNNDTYLYKDYTSPKIKEEIDLQYLYNPNQEQKILILAFNKNAIEDFIKKADKINIKTIVSVEEDGKEYFTEKDTKLSLLIEASTYHSLLLRAAKPIVEKLGYIPDYSKSNFFKKDILFISKKYDLKLTNDEVKLFYKFIENFHNSPKDFVSFIKHWNSDKNNPEIDVIIGKKIKLVISTLYEEMKNHTITMPHCFYYKTVYKMALQNPDYLKNIFKDQQGKEFNMILVDEAQDSDEIIYNLIKMSEKKAIYVGDSYQNIYGFRGTYNVFNDLKNEEIKNTEFFSLNESFRYGKSIATLTSSIPNILNHSNTDVLETIGQKDEDYIHPTSLNISNVKKMIKNIVTTNNNDKKTKKETMNQVAIICRSNKKAFELYSEFKNDSFLSSYVKIESGLKSKTKDFIAKGINAIEDDAIKEQIKGILGLEDFNFEDMINNDEVCSILENTEYSFLLKCKDENLKNAMLQKSTGYETVTIITVHGSKGLEYEKVILADDYTKEENKNLDLLFLDEIKDESSSKKDDEINIIYTAATRAKESLFFMESNLFNQLRKQIEISSKFNSQRLSKENDFLINAEVIELNSKQEKNTNEIKKNIFSNEGLFIMG